MELKNIPQNQYEFNQYEAEIRNYWLEKKFFKPEYDPKAKKVVRTEEMKKDSRKAFSIICPPPNAYGRPHMGNLSGYAYQDVIGRFARMNGKKTLLLPGKDHAGLEGEGVFVREVLEKEGVNKFDMTREQFYQRIWDFNMENKAKALKDEQTIGLSADFDRDIFTLDEKVVNTVLSTFVELYKKNMIYKGVRIGNWDPKSRSAIADNQCERLERDGFIYNIKYPIVQQHAWKLSFYDTSIFDRIKSGAKTIEIRALNPEEPERFFGNIQSGDIIICKDNSENHNPSIYKKVLKTAVFQTLEDAYEAIDWEKVFDQKPKEILELDEKFAQLALGYADKVRRNGLVAIYLTDIEDSEYLQIATTRPETLFGDTAIAVNPQDERYTELIGKGVIVPLVDRVVPIIFDHKVEKDFGTGCLKVTPAHSQDDYQIMLNWNQTVDKEQHDTNAIVGNIPSRQKIGYVNVIDKNLKLCGPVGPKYIGQKYNAAKPTIIEDLKSMGLYISETPIKQNILIGERTKAVIEPLMLPQWFMDIDKIRQPVINMVKDGEVHIHPKYMEKKFYNWMNNLRDWPISRSLWWGYRIPVWYNGEIAEMINDEGQVVMSITIDGNIEELNPGNENHVRIQIEQPDGPYWHQDEDVLDTWFSSGQWPYATLMAHDLMDTFYPTDVMETGYDILENWVSRMMMFSHFKLNRIPFKDVYLHGLVKGTDGQKMSKSRKNMIEVDETDRLYGIDALRMCYFYQNKAGKSYAVTFDKLKNFRNFNNKMWNAAKYILRSISMAEHITREDLDFAVLHKESYISEENKNFCTLFNDRHAKTTEYLNKYRFGLATEKLYDSVWHQFCDIYLEKTKELLKSTDKALVAETLSTLLVCFTGYTKMLHPFIPFVTEKIYQLLRENELINEDVESIMYSDWKM